MINLELLFWAFKIEGRKKLYDIAVSHAEIFNRNYQIGEANMAF
jgi:hypothetical protein